MFFIDGTASYDTHIRYYLRELGRQFDIGNEIVTDGKNALGNKTDTFLRNIDHLNTEIKIHDRVGVFLVKIGYG